MGAGTRRTIDVFKFYQGQTLTAADPGDGPNRYDAFVRVDAFRKLLRWGIRIALEVGGVKERYLHRRRQRDAGVGRRDAWNRFATSRPAAAS